MHFNLLARKTVIVPTLLGWIVVAAVVGITFQAVAQNLAVFLAPTQPINAQILVVEGWLPDYALEQALTEFRSKPYRRILTTGTPIEIGTYLSDDGTFARRAKKVLEKMGLADSLVVAVSADSVARDRTFASGTALRGFLDKTGFATGGVNLVSLGVHTRRSAFLFRRALGAHRAVGCIAVADRSFDRTRWWQSSEGFRTVIDEAIAWIYAVTVGR